MIIGVYHIGDEDGRACAAILKKKFPYCRLVAHQYGWEFPFHLIERDDIVFMCDVSLPVGEMCRVLELCSKFVWIDHHDTAIRDMEQIQDRNFHRVTGEEAGCYLTWKHLFPTRPVPAVIDSLAKYDTWQQDADWWDITVPIELYCKSVSKEDGSHIKFDFLWYEDALAQGQSITRFYRQMEDEMIRKAFEAEFEGYRAICINTTMNISLMADRFKSDYDIVIGFSFNGSGWGYSLRSDKVHCGELAKKYYGGGHFGAAGFHHNKNIFS